MAPHPRSRTPLTWLSGWSGNLLFWCFLLLMIIFPTGRLPSGRWRGPAVAALATSGLFVILSALAPTFDVSTGDSSALVTIANPLAIFPDAPFWQPAAGYGFAAVFAPLIAGVISMLVRWRRSSGVEAQQLRWVVFSLAAVTTGVLIGLVGVIVTGDDNALTWYAALLAFPLPPIAVGIAVLRYRLYEIDRIVSRTIGWAIVTGILATAYVAAILLLGYVFAPLANRNTIVVAASTLAIAALFQPVRRRVQAAVDRQFNRARIDAEKMATEFAGRLRDEVDLDALTVDLRSTIGRRCRTDDELDLDPVQRPCPAGRLVNGCLVIGYRLIARFAPGFRDLVIGRSTRTATAMEDYDTNYVGGVHGWSEHLAARSACVASSASDDRAAPPRATRPLGMAGRVIVLLVVGIGVATAAVVRRFRAPPVRAVR